MSTRFSAPTSRKIVALIVGAFVFLSAAHHLVDYWSKSMAWMLLLFAVCVPLLGWAIYRLYNLIAPHLKAIVPPRIFFWLSIAVPLALVFAWRSYSAPVSYHALTITPLVSPGQKIELLEIKADGVVLNIEQAALVKGWQKEGEVLVATSVSQPFTLSFKGSVNAPTGILFFASSGNDQVKTNLDGQINYINLAGLSGSQKLETYYLGYRSLPNWVFIALLIIIDTVVFGLLFLMVFFIQEIGELNLKQSGLSTAHFIQHRTNLLVLVFLSGSLHLINALSVPLMLDPDSPTYLQGAVYWLQQGNLDGVSMFRGPGTTFLFAPILFLFGRDPWGMKIFLHVLAFGCVFISYRIGWQLSQKRWVAFAVGLVVAITPDLYFYSNVVLSEVINIFIVLAFCTILLTALETRTFRWTIALTLTGSFATLLRPENITLLVIGGIFLIIAPIRQIIGLSISLELRNRSLRELGLLGIAFILALLPIVWWSGHNYKVNGFFGLSNYAKEVFYDGWVYDGISQGYSMKNGESSAEKKIDAAIEKYPVVGTDPSGVPTGWEIYPSLLKTGYSTTQAMDLLGEAAWDSILANPASAARLLLRKFTGDAFEPVTAQMTTFSLSGEIEQGDEMKLAYFDFEKLKIPFLIQFQRLIYNFQQYLYGNLYSFWILLCLLALTISLSRSPTSIWVALILITTTRILVSNILGISLWRYTLAGLIPLEIIAVNWLAVSVYGIKALFLKPNQV